MSTHNDPSFLQWLIGGAASIVGGLFGYHKYLDSRFAKKAEKEDVDDIKDEMGRQRDVQAKIFDQIRDNEHRAQDRHERLMERLTQKE